MRASTACTANKPVLGTRWRAFSLDSSKSRLKQHIRYRLWKHGIHRTQPSGYAASVVSNDVTTIPTVEMDTSAAGFVDQFEWTKQWYPVGVVDMLDPTRPHQVQLLGQMMVLWRDGDGVWQCFDDKCPHRLVPLSEGRVEPDGSLMCAYHAWRFDGKGQCVSIPQSKTKEVEQRNCVNPRACAVAYPTTEKDGVIFVWPEAGPTARIDSQMRPLRNIPELDDDSGRVKPMPWFQADLPYGWDFFIENVTDPAHVPVSHHNMAGNRYTDAKYYDMIVQRPLTTQDGLCCSIEPTAASVQRATMDFQPPCLVRIDSYFAGGSQMCLALYSVPTKPGWCRHIGRQVLIAGEDGKLPKGLSVFALPLPVWLGHVLAPLFLFQDMAFLHGQGVAMSELQEGYIQSCYMPNPQDKMVTYFREWLMRRAGGGVPWPVNMNPRPTRVDGSMLYNVYDIHTKNCRQCQAALKKINVLKMLSAVAAVVCMVQGAVLSAAHMAATAALQGAPPSLLPPSLPPLGSFICAALAVLLAAASLGLHKLSGMFYEYRFSHADNH